jgi:Collagen triple helix repeat (20 copies)
MLTNVLSRARRHAGTCLVALLALAGSAYAATAIPSPGGVIHSCYRKRGGGLRVVPAGARCSRRERPLAFDQRGPRGLPGPRGAQGLRGLRGRTGAQGAKGAPGTNGATNVQVRTAGPTSLPADGAEHDYPATCASGERATGGGYTLSAAVGTPVASRPSPTSGVPTGWDVRMATSTTGATIDVYVICASP